MNPLIDFKFFESDYDLQRCREVVRIAAELGQNSAFADIIEERLQPSDEELASDDALNAFILSNVGQRPAPDQHLQDGPVVRPYGRGRPAGVASTAYRGLRVADASIMPNCVRANTNCTTMMIGERIADYIRQGS